MARIKERIIQELNKPCVVCGGKQCVIEYITTKRGVDRVEEFIECLSCGAKRKIKGHNNKPKESIDFGWGAKDDS